MYMRFDKSIYKSIVKPDHRRDEGFRVVPELERSLLKKRMKNYLLYNSQILKRSVLRALIISVTLLAALSCSSDRKDNSGSSFHHVMLYVSDIEESISFYTDAFDMEVYKRIRELTVERENDQDTAQRNMVFLQFHGNSFILELSQVNADSSDVSCIPLHYQHMGIQIADIKRAYEKALNRGAKNGSGIRNVRAGELRVKNAFLNGPDGELIELIELINPGN